MVTASQAQASIIRADSEGCVVTCPCPIGMGSSR